MAKYENIRALAKKQLQTVTESSDRWKAFLRTAAIAYNYSFPNQLLIHEQSPTATAVADIAYWNNNAGRWVKRGAHGIAVFDTRANSSRLRYLFDISDTIPRAEVPDALPWVITDQNWRPVWDKIVADNHADSIQSALLMLSTSCVSNLANGIEPSIEKTRNMQIQLEQQLASAEEEVKRPFPQATELTEKSKRLAVLEGLLNMNDKDIVTDTEPEQQCQADNRQRGQEER